MLYRYNVSSDKVMTIRNCSRQTAVKTSLTKISNRQSYVKKCRVAATYSFLSVPKKRVLLG